MKNEGFWVQGTTKNEINKIEQKINILGDKIGKDNFDVEEILPSLNQKVIENYLDKIDEDKMRKIKKESWYMEFEVNKETIELIYKEVELLIKNNNSLEEQIEILRLSGDNLKINKINTINGYITRNINTISDNLEKIENLEKLNKDLFIKGTDDTERFIKEN